MYSIDFPRKTIAYVRFRERERVYIKTIVFFYERKTIVLKRDYMHFKQPQQWKNENA